MSDPFSPSYASLSSMQSSDRLGSSPHIRPSAFPPAAKPPSSLSHPCSIVGCAVSTTSPALPALFLSLAALCFSASAASVADFSGKAAVYLCSEHRRRLEEYRQLVVGHAAHSIDLWSDSTHDQHAAAAAQQSSAELHALTAQSPPAPSAADPLLPAGRSRCAPTPLPRVLSRAFCSWLAVSLLCQLPPRQLRPRPQRRIAPSLLTLCPPPPRRCC